MTVLTMPACSAPPVGARLFAERSCRTRLTTHDLPNTLRRLVACKAQVGGRQSFPRALVVPAGGRGGTLGHRSYGGPRGVATHSRGVSQQRRLKAGNTAGRYPRLNADGRGGFSGRVAGTGNREP